MLPPELGIVAGLRRQQREITRLARKAVDGPAGSAQLPVNPVDSAVVKEGAANQRVSLGRERCPIGERLFAR